MNVTRKPGSPEEQPEKTEAGHVLPDFQRLALLAAMLAHKENIADPKGNRWQYYLERALQLHLEAELFHEGLRKKMLSQEELLTEYGSELAWLRHVAHPSDERKNKVQLLLKEKTSPALEYIKEELKYGRAGTPGTVVKYVKEFLGECANDYLSNNRLNDSETGRHIGYNLDKAVIDKAVRKQRKRRAASSAKSQAKSAKGKKRIQKK
jgi:hypothetical protein